MSTPPPDKNFFNISGTDDGNIWVNDVLTFTADQPGMRKLSIGSVMPPLGPDGKPIYDDALKISGIRRLIITVDVLDGRACREDAVDINHSEDVELHVSTLYPGQTFCGTIKGESKRCSVSVDRQIGHAREVDWDYGNHDNTRNGYTVEQTLSARATDDSVNTVRCLQATAPKLLNGPYRYLFPSPTAWYHNIAVWIWGLFA